MGAVITIFRRIRRRPAALTTGPAQRGPQEPAPVPFSHQPGIPPRDPQDVH